MIQTHFVKCNPSCYFLLFISLNRSLSDNFALRSKAIQCQFVLVYFLFYFGLMVYLGKLPIFFRFVDKCDRMLTCSLIPIQDAGTFSVVLYTCCYTCYSFSFHTMWGSYPRLDYLKKIGFLFLMDDNSYF